MLSKPFDQLSQRSVDVSVTTTNATVSKRSSGLDILSENDTATYKVTPMEKLVSSLDFYEATLITGCGNRRESLTINPEIRATILPLLHILYTPIRFFFSFIEGLLLIAVYTIHRIFTFAAGVAWFAFQIWMYSIAEELIGGVLKALDQIIVELLPDWTPSILVSGAATMLGVAGMALASWGA